MFGSFFDAPLGLVLSVVLLLAFFFYRNVLLHNIAIILGICGISMVLGLSLTPKAVVILLIVLSFYDIIAVYKTKHMIKLAKSMIESGAIFGFVIPSSMAGFLASSREAQAQAGGQFIILGSGDIGLPLIMICSLIPVSIGMAIITAFFSLIGLFFTHLIFINQKSRQPMAALPPIATMTVIGYFVATIFTF